jgi:hypothetical protein
VRSIGFMVERRDDVERPKTKWLDVFSSFGVARIGGLLALSAGLAALVAIALYAITHISNASSIASIASGAFGVIGSIVGAYFGVKVGTDTTKKALANTDSTLQVAQDAIAAQQAESARAQAFAGHVDPNLFDSAVQHAVALVSSTPGRGGAAAPGEPSPEAQVDVVPGAADQPFDQEPVNVFPPQIFGNPRVGETLTASAGSWLGSPPLTYEFSWSSRTVGPARRYQLGGETFLLEPGDAGATVTVLVTASDSEGRSAVAASQAVAIEAAEDAEQQEGEGLGAGADAPDDEEIPPGAPA